MELRILARGVRSVLVLLSTTGCLVFGCMADVPNDEATASVTADVRLGLTRAWTDKERPRARAKPGQEAPVHSYRVDAFDPRATIDDDDDSPLVPPKGALSEDDQTAGIDR